MKETDKPSSDRHRKYPLGSERTHSEDGVDLTLIRWMLSLTPAERLKVLQQSVQSLLTLREGNAKR